MWLRWCGDGGTVKAFAGAGQKATQRSQFERGQWGREKGEQVRRRYFPLTPIHRASFSQEDFFCGKGCEAGAGAHHLRRRR